MKIKQILVAAAMVLAFGTSAHSEPLTRDQVPEPLKPWNEWVLLGHEQDLCPFLQGIEAQRPCAWPSPIVLSLDEKSGHFSQSWRLFTDGWVSLPGDEKHWPLNVKSDGQPAAVIWRDNHPQLFLKSGEHAVDGTFQWDSLPESFPIPAETGAIKLSVRGAAVGRPNLTDDGILWLQAKAKEGQAEDSLDFRIHRLMNDDIPFVLTTSIDMDVSGKTREVVFAPLLPEKFVPMSLVSPLPAHLEDDGTLKVQVRSGHWQVRLEARHEGPVTEITLPKVNTPADEAANAGLVSQDEVWVFEPQSDLRLVSIEGVPAVDPQQTTLPQEWKHLAAYRVQRGDTLRLMEQKRGDSGAPDQLTLHRNLWLDFNGGGFTIQDQIGGTFHRNARLEMNMPVTLGRVSSEGQDQLITRLPGSAMAGIEVRQGAANISADSRIDGRRSALPAIGWNHDFQNVSGILNLPPGWRVFAVWGADQVPDTWLNRWTLLEIFLVLVLSLSFAKIWTPKWGAIAIVTLTLTFPEQEAPQWVWLAVLVGEALMRLLPPGFKGRIRIPLKLYRIASLIALISIAVPFAATSLRHALYPSLETPYTTSVFAVGGGEMGGVGAPAPAAAPMPKAADMEEAAPPPPPQEMDARKPVMAEDRAVMGKREDNRPQQIALSLSKKAVSRQLLQQAPGAQVQTGPGLPQWNWTQIPLQWSGPVVKDQMLRLILFSPCMNLFLAFLRVLLIALLILRTLDFPGNFWPGFMKRQAVAGWLLMLGVGLSLVCAPQNARAEFPSPDLLNQLRDKLLEKPACTPECAAIANMSLEANATTLRMRLEISVQARTAVPLPANPKEWSPDQVSIDGSKFAGVRRSPDGRAWIELAPGVHQVLLEGPLSDRQSVQIPLPLKPHHVETSLQGWSIAGLHEDGQAEDNLQLSRTQPLEAGKDATAKTAVNNLPPFVRVERRLIFGLTWSVETQIVRLTPADSSIVLEVPLLAGESVTSEGVRVQDGKVLVSMGPQTSNFSWSSVLQPSDALTLTVPAQASWVEEWTVDAGAIWHVDYEGIPLIPSQEGDGGLLWRPWPGEKVSLKISRPEGVPGQTITLDSSVLSVSPGLRFTESTLTLNLRSSLGGQHVITLPAGAELQSVSVNGQIQPIRPVDAKVTLPLAPGSQSFELKWQQEGGIGTFFRAPSVDVGVPNVNAEIQFQLPERWTLLVGGPRLGPAVLFWSLLMVMILVAAGLSRTGLAPLKAYHWVLLSLGLTQTPIWASLIFAGWFLVMGWRQKNPRSGSWSFDLLQIALVAWTVTAVIILFASIHQGLLGSPDMQILGNNSTTTLLKWFQDRSGSTLPRPWVISLPMFSYRIAMLSWALWVAWAFIDWIKWAWKSFTTGGTWKPVRVVKKTV